MPRASYSINWSGFLSPLGTGCFKGAALTKSADGASYVVATTAALAASSSGTIDAVALSVGGPGESIPIQQDGVVDPDVTGLPAGIVEPAVVDTAGVIRRFSAFPAGTAFGTANKEGGVALTSSGGGGGGLGGGYVAHNVVSDADFSLSSSEWAHQVIRITDTAPVLTTLRTVTVPSNGGDTRVVHNDTGFPLAIKSSGGTVVIPAGASKLIDAKNTDFATSDVTPTVINVADYGVTGRFDLTDSDRLQAALSDAQAVGGPSQLHFRARSPNPAPPGGNPYQDVYLLTRPLYVTRTLFELRGSAWGTTHLRTSGYVGPCIVVGTPTNHAAQLATSTVPAHSGNPAPQMWKTDGAATPVLNAVTREWMLDGMANITIEFFFKLTSGVTGGNVYSILSSSGTACPEEFGNVLPIAFLFELAGGAILGSDNTLRAELKTTSGTSIIDTVLTVGTTYHVALCYGSGTVRLFVTPITTGTLVTAGTASASGTVVQNPGEWVNVGPQSQSEAVGQISLFGAPGLITGIRLSQVVRYTGGEATPTTCWDRTAIQSGTRFILQFDEFYQDIFVGTTAQNTNKLYLPPFTNGFSIGQVAIDKISCDAGVVATDGIGDGGGFWLMGVTAAKITDCGGAAHIPLVMSNCLYGLVSFFFCQVAGQYGIYQTGNVTQFYKCQTLGGSSAAGFGIHSNAGGALTDCIAQDAQGRAFEFAESVLDVHNFVVDSESVLVNKMADKGICGRISVVRFLSGGLDGGIAGGGSGVPPLTVGNASIVTLVNTELEGSSGSPASSQLVRIVGTPRAPVILDSCYFADKFTNAASLDDLPAIPVTLSPEWVVLRRGDAYQQSGGRAEWRSKRTNATQRTRALQGGVRTTTATTTNVPFDFPAASLVPLTDGAVTRIDAVITALGSNWAWTQVRRLSFTRSGSTVTASTNSTADAGADTIGSAPAISAAIVNSTTNWAIALTSTATTIDWIVNVTATEVSVP